MRTEALFMKYLSLSNRCQAALLHICVHSLEAVQVQTELVLFYSVSHSMITSSDYSVLNLHQEVQRTLIYVTSRRHLAPLLFRISM